MADKAVKTTTQKDIDQAYARIHTGMEEVGRASTQMSEAQTRAFLSQGRESGSSPFDAQISRLGGVQNLSMEIDVVDGLEEEANEENNEAETVNSSGHQEVHRSGDGKNAVARQAQGAQGLVQQRDPDRRSSTRRPWVA